MSDPDKALEEAKRTPQTRGDAAVGLLVSGASYADIAKLLEYRDVNAAKLACDKALARTVTVPEKEAMRTVVHQRYERLLKSVMPRATNPKDSQHLAYNARANSIVDRMSKLHGLDAPTQVQFTPTQEYLEDYTRQIQASLGLNPDEVEEADIFEDMGEMDE